MKNHLQNQKIQSTKQQNQKYILKNIPKDIKTNNNYRNLSFKHIHAKLKSWKK